MYKHKDFYFKKAKKDQFVARSIYKLEEIDQRFKLIRAGDQVIDLGAAPGSWSQYIAKKIGPKGRLLGIDLQKIQLAFPNAVFLQDDILKIDLEAALKEYEFAPPFDVVVSDMAPKTTGIRVTDEARSIELCEMALDSAYRFLKPKGNFVCKLFQGEDFEAFRGKMRKAFQKVDILRPKSTRKSSKEVFLVGRGFTNPPQDQPDKTDTER